MPSLLQDPLQAQQWVQFTLQLPSLLQDLPTHSSASLHIADAITPEGCCPNSRVDAVYTPHAITLAGSYPHTQGSPDHTADVITPARCYPYTQVGSVHTADAISPEGSCLHNAVVEFGSYPEIPVNPVPTADAISLQDSLHTLHWVQFTFYMLSLLQDSIHTLE